MRKNALRTRLKERLDGAHDVRVVTLGMARAKAVFAAQLLAPPAVINQMQVHT
jgi:hypothetical protein